MIDLKHTTYHHFVGGGRFDSQIDVLAYSNKKLAYENVTHIKCRLKFPEILSHHDMVMSDFVIPVVPNPTTVKSGNTASAPRIKLERVKIKWSEEGILQYSNIVGPLLTKIRGDWLKVDSPSSMSVLMQLTNKILIHTSQCINKRIVYNSDANVGRSSIPKAIKTALNRLNRAKNKHMLKLNDPDYSGHCFSAAKKEYKDAIQKYHNQQYCKRDDFLDSNFKTKPQKFYRWIRNQKRGEVTKIKKLRVGDRLFLDDNVADGFYQSMVDLKAWPENEIENNPYLRDQLLLYKHLISLYEHDLQLPSISLQTSNDLLKEVKNNVSDIFGITPLHFLNAGDEGCLHFNLLLNGIIEDLRNVSLHELNTVYGLFLYKGHEKDKTIHRSYRTISTCPLVAKCLDLYLRKCYSHIWDSEQAETQFQGSGSSHELASLLVTEAIQHSLFVSKRPLFLLALDAQSAFDRCLPQILCNELFRMNLPGAAINYINNRLVNRETVYEWDGNLMGPAKDRTGFEQGAINSSDFYKIYNNSQLKAAQESQLGVSIGSSIISAVGQADDVILLSSEIFNLQLLTALTESYCHKNRVLLEPAKTKLIAFAPTQDDLSVQKAKIAHNVTINNVKVTFSDELEHVGVIRHTGGNMPHILKRIGMHQRSLAAILFTGAAKSHRGNPAATLRLHSLYCTPVLLSGMASLVLKEKELKLLDQHFTRTLSRLQRLNEKTPRSVVHLLAGSLPFKALLDMRLLSLFLMICHKPDNPLHQHAKYVLTSGANRCSSWFLIIREVCKTYSIEHPLTLLDNPPEKKQFKKLLKLKVVGFWQEHLSAECSSPDLRSTRFLNPFKCSLLRPHPIWQYSSKSAYETNKATVLAKMLSGRYRTEALCRFWSSNTEGYCEAETCSNVLGDIVHLLAVCPALDSDRQRVFELWASKSIYLPELFHLLLRMMQAEPEILTQFILNADSDPEIINLVQLHGEKVLDHLLYLTRTMAYHLHKKKMMLSGKWSPN